MCLVILNNSTESILLKIGKRILVLINITILLSLIIIIIRLACFRYLFIKYSFHNDRM
jgi:hypothetical protein